MNRFVAFHFLYFSCTLAFPQRGASSVDPIAQAHDFSVILANAKIALVEKQYDGANGLFHEALKLREPWDSYTFLRASAAGYLVGDSTWGLTMLHKAIATGATWADIEEIGLDVDRSTIVSFTRAYRSTAPSAIREFARTVDFESYSLIRDMITEDQCIRNVPHRAVHDSVFLSYMGSQDSTRFVHLVEMVERKGWPTFERIGNMNSLLPLLLMHNIGVAYATDAHWAILRSAIRKEVAEGMEAGQMLALLEDTFLRRAGQPQRYGTESDGWETIPTYYVIDACGTIDDRRREIGMIPLALDAQKRGLQLPACYGKAK